MAKIIDIECVCGKTLPVLRFENMSCPDCHSLVMEVLDHQEPEEAYVFPENLLANFRRSTEIQVLRHIENVRTNYILERFTSKGYFDSHRYLVISMRDDFFVKVDLANAFLGARAMVGDLPLPFMLRNLSEESKRGLFPEFAQILLVGPTPANLVAQILDLAGLQEPDRPVSNVFLQNLVNVVAEPNRPINCCVCQVDEDNGLMKQLPCLHTFHRECITPWFKLKSFCPLCRRVFPTIYDEFNHWRDNA